MKKYRRKSDGEIVEAAQTAWQVESSDGEFRYVVPVLGSNFRDEYEAVTEPKSTDADFNKFRHKETGEVVEAWQWWPGKSWGWTRLAGWHAGVWLADPCGPDEMAYGPGLFSDTYEPIHPERKRLQSLCDEINAQPGMPALCPELLAARADGRVVDTNSGFYVKDREPEKPAEEAICAECERYREALRRIRLLLGYGIRGCPTDGEYHARTYDEAHTIAQQALDQSPHFKRKAE